MTKTSKQVILIFVLIIIGIFGLYKLAKMFSPGSYPYAEIYELNYAEEKVINAINQFKAKYPEMTAPKVTINQSGFFDLTESEGRKNNSFWYDIYFYYPKENQILFTWTRPNGREKTSFSFVSINNGLDIGHWKNINSDFRFTENKKLKKQFEERILKPIETILINEK